ncbi:hypothetical protein Tsp_01880, partial [Trichinella spiralis]|uniref:hypothetical protein n=1 Tax=Trichinella spiralis TaxID=6334 RepID=UPI0001EFB2F2
MFTHNSHQTSSFINSVITKTLLYTTFTKRVLAGPKYYFIFIFTLADICEAIQSHLIVYNGKRYELKGSVFQRTHGNCGSPNPTIILRRRCIGKFSFQNELTTLHIFNRQWSCMRQCHDCSCLFIYRCVNNFPLITTQLPENPIKTCKQWHCKKITVQQNNLPFALNEKEFDVLKEHMQQFYREGPYKMDNVSGVVTRCADYQAEEMFREKIDKNQAASAAGQPIKSRRLCNRLQRVRRCMSRRQILCVKCLNKMINSEKDLETPTNKRASTTKPKNTPPRKKKNKQKTTEVDSPSKNLERQVADVEFTGVTATVTADTITTTTVTTASVVTTVTTTAATATITTATVVPSEINAENVESEISTNDEPQPIQAEVETEILVVDDDEARDKVVEEQSEPVLLDVVPENPSIPKQNVEQETFSVPKKSARKSLTEICSELTTKKLELQAAMEVGQQPKLPEATAVQLNSNDDNRLIEIIEQPLPKTKDGVEQEVNDLPSMELENVDIVTIPAVNEPNDDQASTEIVIVQEMDTVSIPTVHESNDDQASTEIVIVEEMDTVSIPTVNEPNDDQASTEIVIVEEMDTVSIP